MADKKIQKEASKIFSFEELKTFKEIKRLSASSKNTFDNTILMLFKMVGNNKMKMKNIKMAQLSFFVKEFFREIKLTKKNEKTIRTKTIACFKLFLEVKTTSET